jgi:phosphohistidine phosphatase
MKSLTLLRHAKSSWDDTVARDFDRPLNPRGRRAAGAVAQEMKRLGLGFDCVLASPARRVAETLAEVEAVFGALEARLDERIYLASTQTLLDLVRETGASVERLLIAGHNPGLETLALLLTQGHGLRDEVELKYPTGTLAEIALPVGDWKSVGKGAGELVRFIRPRDLDPSLGPDGT